MDWKNILPAAIGWFIATKYAAVLNWMTRMEIANQSGLQNAQNQISGVVSIYLECITASGKDRKKNITKQSFMTQKINIFEIMLSDIFQRTPPIITREIFALREIVTTEEVADEKTLPSNPGDNLHRRIYEIQEIILGAIRDGLESKRPKHSIVYYVLFVWSGFSRP